ncbi:hypothetical protein HYPSUDRAFT_207659 [Hypholoma sublateritium FD-334 SS-4]|uniref:Uncharacterized protein n=1 Tax=Hypholoma sublateritium (strain FD-334 SS-4) TaxID=945553 RepID=A0A0D2P5P1_HYPSF|nr:hypothetical protein HYPSUDRAFT_207659 [Hypholoma sublateritium FD-334 SS-4]
MRTLTLLPRLPLIKALLSQGNLLPSAPRPLLPFATPARDDRCVGDHLTYGRCMRCAPAAMGASPYHQSRTPSLLMSAPPPPPSYVHPARFAPQFPSPRSLWSCRACTRNQHRDRRVPTLWIGRHAALRALHDGTATAAVPHVRVCTPAEAALGLNARIQMWEDHEDERKALRWYMREHDTGGHLPDTRPRCSHGAFFLNHDDDVDHPKNTAPAESIHAAQVIASLAPTSRSALSSSRTGFKPPAPLSKAFRRALGFQLRSAAARDAFCIRGTRMCYAPTRTGAAPYRKAGTPSLQFPRRPPRPHGAHPPRTAHHQPHVHAACGLRVLAARTMTAVVPAFWNRKPPLPADCTAEQPPLALATSLQIPTITPSVPITLSRSSRHPPVPRSHSSSVPGPRAGDTCSGWGAHVRGNAAACALRRPPPELQNTRAAARSTRTDLSRTPGRAMAPIRKWAPHTLRTYTARARCPANPAKAWLYNSRRTGRTLRATSMLSILRSHPSSQDHKPARERPARRACQCPARKHSTCTDIPRAPRALQPRLRCVSSSNGTALRTDATCHSPPARTHPLSQTPAPKSAEVEGVRATWPKRALRIVFDAPLDAATWILASACLQPPTCQVGTRSAGRCTTDGGTAHSALCALHAVHQHEGEGDGAPHRAPVKWTVDARSKRAAGSARCLQRASGAVICAADPMHMDSRPGCSSAKTCADGAGLSSLHVECMGASRARSTYRRHAGGMWAYGRAHCACSKARKETPRARDRDCTGVKCWLDAAERGSIPAPLALDPSRRVHYPTPSFHSAGKTSRRRVTTPRAAARIGITQVATVCMYEAG